MLVEEKKQSISGPILITLAALLWSTAGLLIKYVPWHPLAITSTRSFLATLIFLVAYRQRLFRKPNRLTWISGIAVILTQTGFVIANKLTTATNAIMLQYVSPLFIVLLGALFFHYRPARREVVTLLIAIFGIVLFFFDDISPGNQIGNLLALFTGLTFSIVILLNSRSECDTPVALFIGQFGTFLLGLPFVFTVRDWDVLPVVSIFLLGIFQLGLAYLCFSAGIKKTKPLNANLLAMIEPIMNPVWVFLFLGEKPGLPALTGAVIVIAAVTYLNSGKLKNAKNQ